MFIKNTKKPGNKIAKTNQNGNNMLIISGIYKIRPKNFKETDQKTN